MATQTITIISTIDVVSALSDGSLDNNIYLLDNNKAKGSTGEGTGALRSMVQPGDVLVWTVMPIEPEIYVSITDVQIDPAYCEARQGVYGSTGVHYWTGRIKQAVTELPYQLSYKIGSSEEDFSWRMGLIGQ